MVGVSILIQFYLENLTEISFDMVANFKFYISYLVLIRNKALSIPIGKSYILGSSILGNFDINYYN